MASATDHTAVLNSGKYAQIQVKYFSQNFMGSKALSNVS